MGEMVKSHYGNLFSQELSIRALLFSVVIRYGSLAMRMAAFSWTFSLLIDTLPSFNIVQIG